MVAYNYGRTWADRTREYARNLTRPITGTVLEERQKAFLIDSVARGPVWLPKRLVSHDAERGVFHVPSWLAEKKLLD